MFTLTNANGIVVRVTNYGGIIMSLLVPDRAGRQANVVLGFDSPEDYRDNPRYPAFPSTILRPGGEYRSRTVFTFGILETTKEGR